VQVYDGFFRANPSVDGYRFDHIGGPDTRGPACGATPAGAGKVAFSIGASGGVSYRWDFGDGRSSTAQSPTHNYGGAGTFEVKLTVKHAGGVQ
jgi:hypothetical protein